MHCDAGNSLRNPSRQKIKELKFHGFLTAINGSIAIEFLSNAFPCQCDAK